MTWLCCFLEGSWNAISTNIWPKDFSVTSWNSMALGDCTCPKFPQASQPNLEFTLSISTRPVESRQGRVGRSRSHHASHAKGDGWARKLCDRCLRGLTQSMVLKLPVEDTQDGDQALLVFNTFTAGKLREAVLERDEDSDIAQVCSVSRYEDIILFRFISRPKVDCLGCLATDAAAYHPEVTIRHPEEADGVGGTASQSKLAPS
ncbi:hypothetical protein QBC41DRAFT_66228 [Cercophora samala]|uniref:Uncharacterized protein n=1 Tax=Cercophora samala TaxID=330535 RepID=A0AA40DE56_9PEZI|nr:hypothetical protein QBC41DRAFT_66228 [Cercophora samala]